MMAKLLAQTSFYCVALVLPFLLISASRKEHPVTLLRELWTRAVKTIMAGIEVTKSASTKGPLRPLLDGILTRLGFQPPSRTAVPSDPDTVLRPPLGEAELEASSIEELRQGEDLSLAYREISTVPEKFAHCDGALAIKRLDLTECGIRWVAVGTLGNRVSGRVLNVCVCDKPIAASALESASQFT